MRRVFLFHGLNRFNQLQCYLILLQVIHSPLFHLELRAPISLNSKIHKS